jgi:hypothetical protein
MPNIKFINTEHKAFFNKMLIEAKKSDVYHKAFFYTTGITTETRWNIRTFFDFHEDCIIPEGLSEGWQTGGTRRLCLLAFNLWNGWTEDGNEKLSTPYELFDCEFAPYFFQAIQLRYPEYCRNKEPFTHDLI